MSIARPNVDTVVFGVLCAPCERRNPILLQIKYFEMRFAYMAGIYENIYSELLYEWCHSSVCMY